MNIGIFSGSFNPIHQGHLMIANFVSEFTPLDEIWFLVSPQNPFKETYTLIPQEHRLKMVELALDGYEQLRASDFEFHLPVPSYTVDTLRALTSKYPEHTFSLVIGADNWNLFEQWRDHEAIIQQHHIYVYQRLNYPVTISDEYKSQVEALHSPIIEISSTFIRQCIREGRNIKSFLPEKVWNYIFQHNLYQD